MIWILATKIKVSYPNHSSRAESKRQTKHHGIFVAQQAWSYLFHRLIFRPPRSCSVGSHPASLSLKELSSIIASPRRLLSQQCVDINVKHPFIRHYSNMTMVAVFIHFLWQTSLFKFSIVIYFCMCNHILCPNLHLRKYIKNQTLIKFRFCIDYGYIFHHSYFVLSASPKTGGILCFPWGSLWNVALPWFRRRWYFEQKILTEYLVSTMLKNYFVMSLFLILSLSIGHSF